MELKFSQDLEILLHRLANQTLTLKDILAETSERGFSLIIGLLVLPFLLPMPPGLSSVLGSGIILLAGQMMLGRRQPWLPTKVAQFKFPKELTQRLLKLLKVITKKLEKIVRPRWLSIATSPNVWRINRLFFAWLAILLALPIPFTNPIPTVGILLLVFASLEEDGLLLCVGYGLTVLITIGFVLLLYLLWQVPGFVLF
jgi:hypothetical protein